MDTPRFTGLHAELTDRILSAYFKVYDELGFGFPESVYREALRLVLVSYELGAIAEVPIQVLFRGEPVGQFRADLVVEGKVLLELKAIDTLSKEHESQTINYLRSTDLEVALLLNFGPIPRFKRFILENSRKKAIHHRLSNLSVPKLSSS